MKKYVRMEELETLFDFHDFLDVKNALDPDSDRPVHVIKFVFAIAISVQVVLVFKFVKRFFSCFIDFVIYTSRSFLHRLVCLFRRRQETTHDVINAIPVLCESALRDLEDEIFNESVKESSYLDLLCLTLLKDNDRVTTKIPPSLLLKSAISWLLCDLLLLLSRCNRHKLALQYPQRLALEYRTIDKIPYFMERLASETSTKRIRLPVLIEPNEKLVSIHYSNSIIPIYLLDLYILYIRLRQCIPLLILPRLPAIRSRYDYNLEKYRKDTAIKKTGRSASLKILHRESQVKVKERVQVCKSDGSPCKKDLCEEEVTMREDRSENVENWMLSVTALSTVLNDPKLNERQKAYIIRRQMELRNIHSPKRWKWRSALTYLESRLAKSSSTQGNPSCTRRPSSVGVSRPASTNLTPKHTPKRRPKRQDLV